MRRFLLVLASIFLAGSTAHATDHYVAPTGTPGAAGTLADPWDLQTALSQPPGVAPGDTIWLRGGTYGGAHTSLLAGTEASPITVRAYRRERVVIDYATNTNCNPAAPDDCTASNRRCNALTVPACSHDVVFRDLEITSSEAGGRVSLPPGGCASAPSCCYVDGVAPPLKPECGDTPPGIARAQWNPVHVLGHGITLVNLVVHDGGTGIVADSFAIDTEVYGALSFNNGWVDPVSGHGHGSDVENATPSWAPSAKQVRNSVLWNNFGDGFHSAADWGHFVANLEADEVVAFNNGAPAASFWATAPATYPAGQGARRPNFVLEGKESPYREVVRAARLYQPLTSAAVPNRLGHGDFADLGNTAGDIVLEDSYVASAGTPLRLERIDTMRMTGNTLVGGATAAVGDGESVVHLVKYECKNAFESWWVPEYAQILDDNDYFYNGGSATPFHFEVGSSQYVDFAGWMAGLKNGREAASTYTAGLPTNNAVFVQPNTWEAGRAHVVIYNWAGSSSVAVSLAGIGLAEGQSYKVYNLQAFDLAAVSDWFGTAVATGTYGSASPSVAIPMTDPTVTAPIGLGGAVASTLPQFGVFLVRSTPCGDGWLDAGEQCDDGDLASGDGCSAGCALESCWSCAGTPSVCAPSAVGQACAADGTVCTNDVCDGAGHCGVANALPCDDGLHCNGADTCAGGTCQHAGDPCTAMADCMRHCDEALDACVLDVAGAPCASDANPCTNDTCDGAGACVHTNNSATCDDGVFCNGADACSGGACLHAGDPCAGGGECNDFCNEAAADCAAPAGTACADDALPCTLDHCDGVGACVHPAGNTGATCGVAGPCEVAATCNGTDTECPPNGWVADGSACDDGDVCTNGGTCESGSCANGTPVVCPICQSCDATEGCVPRPRLDCRTPVVGGKAFLAISDKTPDDKDQFQWKWSAGAATQKADFRDPVGSHDYVLCLYDGTGLLATFTAPAAGTCGTKPCWADKPKGYQYKDKAATPDGITQLQLSEGAHGKAKIQVKGKGLDLPDVDLSTLTSPLTVQLEPAIGGVCFGATYSFPPVLKNDGVSFKDKAD